LPVSLRDPLWEQIEEVRRIHRRDLALGAGDVWLPEALSRIISGGRERIAGSTSSRPRGSRPTRVFLAVDDSEIVIAGVRHTLLRAVNFRRGPLLSCPPGCR